MKKLYLFLDKHIVGLVRLWMILLIPVALNRHFAEWMLTANVAVWLLVLCGQHKGWKEDGK